MEKEELDNLLYSRNLEHKQNAEASYYNHCLEQYRIFLHIFNSTSERRLKANEFFLGVNTAIMGILGYLESKGPVGRPVIFLLVPLVGVAICICWYKIIRSYRQLSRAKFKIIHAVEQKLPLSLWSTEWEILRSGKDEPRYRPLSSTEMLIPVIFSVLYILIFVSSFPWNSISSLLK